MFFTCDTVVTYLSQDILSIKQTFSVYRHGPIGSFWIGTTFDLNTGGKIL